MEDCVAYFTRDHGEMLGADVSRHNHLLASFLATGDVRAYQQSLIGLLRFLFTYFLSLFIDSLVTPLGMNLVLK